MKRISKLTALSFFHQLSLDIDCIVNHGLALVKLKSIYFLDLRVLFLRIIFNLFSRRHFFLYARVISFRLNTRLDWVYTIQKI